MDIRKKRKRGEWYTTISKPRGHPSSEHKSTVVQLAEGVGPLSLRFSPSVLGGKGDEGTPYSRLNRSPKKRQVPARKILDRRDRNHPDGPKGGGGKGEAKRRPYLLKLTGFFPFPLNSTANREGGGRQKEYLYWRACAGTAIGGLNRRKKSPQSAAPRPGEKKNKTPAGRRMPFKALYKPPQFRA